MLKTELTGYASGAERQEKSGVLPHNAARNFLGISSGLWLFQKIIVGADVRRLHYLFCLQTKISQSPPYVGCYRVMDFRLTAHFKARKTFMKASKRLRSNLPRNRPCSRNVEPTMNPSASRK